MIDSIYSAEWIDSESQPIFEARSVGVALTDCGASTVALASRAEVQGICIGLAWTKDKGIFKTSDEHEHLTLWIS